MRLLRENGFEVDRIKGSHHQMRKEGWPVTVTVPHPKKQLGPGLVNAILKQAGLK
ncbi:type II toxin-antitoxin system HicA family toxin [Nitrosospira sp. Nsp2]|uniref:type II toxin-antitoxin system HicA family toxin n=1 Tax=Nitrosospira sp. Nsp2 TaxID=136548 RepID=UPI002159AF4B|nr:type II toxin-antitoxin system HicA family toxin [Nitrosospira sp. Nsp2]